MTPREKEAVKLAVRGMSSQEIAREMGITSKVVQEYLRRTYKKFNLRGRYQLILHFYKEWGDDANNE